MFLGYLESDQKPFLASKLVTYYNTPGQIPFEATTDICVQIICSALIIEFQPLV